MRGCRNEELREKVKMEAGLVVPLALSWSETDTEPLERWKMLLLPLLLKVLRKFVQDLSRDWEVGLRLRVIRGLSELEAGVGNEASGSLDGGEAD